MCNLYSHTKGPKAIRDLVKGLGDWADHTGNLPPKTAIYPDGVAPIVRNTATGRELLNMRWGFPSPPQSKSPYTTNVRHLKSNFWKPWLGRDHRCLVPVTSFCEPDWRSGKHVPTWFALDESRPLFFFAGIWRPWTGTRGTKKDPVTGEHQVFAFLTTEPNAEVKPVHEKAMPVILRDRAGWETWLKGSVAEGLGLQRPAPDGTLKVVATGLRNDGP